jgi:4-amino-4-deoxy-L-arabinose transferase-like glycosyltransferase
LPAFNNQKFFGSFFQKRTASFFVLLLILFGSLARLLFGWLLGLGIDESYMVAAGRQFRLGYLDHPPASWWLAWTASHIAGSEAPLVARLPFIALFALSTWLIYRLTTALYDNRAGFWAAVLLNIVPVLGVTAGSWVLPDGPLIAALLGATLCLVRALPERESEYGWWLGAGACFGVALCSKYTALPVGFGAVLYFVTEPKARNWLARPQPYAASLLALAMFAPVLAWNAAHGWASLLFEGGRAAGNRWHPFGPFAALGGEAVFFLPWIWLGLAWCLWQAARSGRGDPRSWLLLCLALPTILLFELVSLRARVFYHWAAPGLMFALPLLGDAIARHWRTSIALRRITFFTAAAVPLCSLLIGTDVRFNWLPGKDPVLAMVDWTSLHEDLANQGDLAPGAVLAAVRWSDAAKIDYAMRGEVPVICLGDDPREYGLSAPATNYIGRDILIISPHATASSLAERFGANFDRIEALPSITLLHAAAPAMELGVFRGIRLHGVIAKEVRNN